jgi:hypothetical protein
VPIQKWSFHAPSALDDMIYLLKMEHDSFKGHFLQAPAGYACRPPLRIEKIPISEWTRIKVCGFI